MWLFFWFCIGFCWLCFLPYAIIIGNVEKGNPFTTAIIIFLIAITLLLIITQTLYYLKKAKNEKSLQELMLDKDFSQINNISPYAFEDWVARLMRIQGYNAYATKYSGDYGVDVIAEIDNKKIGIQVKKFNGPVGIKAVQEIASGMAYYECNEGWVISTAPYFTQAAKNLASKHGIKLFNKYDLANYFQKIQQQYRINNTNTTC